MPICGTITVPSGVALTIGNGSTLSSANQALNVSGNFNADNATLVGINLNYNDGSAGTLQNSDISYDFNDCAIRIDDASPTIQGNTFLDTPGGIGSKICVTGSSVLAPASKAGMSSPLALQAK